QHSAPPAIARPAILAGGRVGASISPVLQFFLSRQSRWAVSATKRGGSIHDSLPRPAGHSPRSPARRNQPPGSFAIPWQWLSGAAARRARYLLFPRVRGPPRIGVLPEAAVPIPLGEAPESR